MRFGVMFLGISRLMARNDLKARERKFNVRDTHCAMNGTVSAPKGGRGVALASS
jgi:hypothetical protein